MKNSSKINKFSDFAKEDAKIEGEKIKIEEVLGKKIIVFKYKIRESKFDGNYASIQIKYQEKKRAIFTGSKILIEQLTKYQDYLPFEAIIKKVGRYYTFT